MIEEELLLLIEKQRHDIEILKITTDNLIELFLHHLKNDGHVGGVSKEVIKMELIKRDAKERGII